MHGRQQRSLALDVAVDDWESLEQNDGENWGNDVFDHGNVGLTFWDSKNFAPKVECKEKFFELSNRCLGSEIQNKVYYEGQSPGYSSMLNVPPRSRASGSRGHPVRMVPMSLLKINI